MFVRSLLNTRWALASALLLVGGLALALPDQFVTRAYELSKTPDANISLIYGLGLAMIAAGFAVLAEQDEPYSGPRLWIFIPVVLCTLLYFLALAQVLKGWWIDDAGITFSYSRSLADGFGLVAQPWLPPEEGYSSSVWMLLLSGMARLGADIPLAAKYLGLGLSATCMIVCAWILTRETRSPLAVLVCCIGIASGPTVTWAASGQEHALQALLLLAVVVCAYLLDNWRWPAALALTVLVLTRPETPIIVIAVFLAAVFLTRRAGGRLINAADAAVALLPFLAFVGLVSFRYFYFGDLLPNPYYAKSSGTSLTGLANPLGGGWAYILAGLRDTALLVVLPLAFLIRIRPLPDWIVVAGAVLAGHLFFVIWAKGDWMGQYRFLMPILPVALLLTSLGFQGVQGLAARRIFGTVAMLILTHTAIMQLASFSARPTTPMAVVTNVGNTFRALADRLEINDPMLAHHDAGGIAYHRMIRLVDLGGLVNRTIGKNMEDKVFLTAYLLDDLQPDFVFGAYNFAAASGFSNTETFAKDYVRLEFTDLPFMRSDLSYIRRDRVVPAPGIDLLYDDATGALLQVQVHDPES